jgi:hypothetical protein
MKSTIISLFTLGLVLTFAPSALKAQPASPNPPGQISYQGFLTDANGLPLATNNPVNYTVEFRIWNQSSGDSNPMWGEQQVVTVDRGYFTVLLGNGSSLSGGVPFTNNLAGIFSGSDASDRYLEMTVMGLAIQPRLRLLTTPYSFLASSALVANSALSVPDNSLSTNVALRGAANTFTGDQTITGGNIYMDNNTGIFGKDTSGFQEFCLFPRDQTNRTLLSYGTGGLYISPTAKPPIMFMDPNGFNVGIRDTSPGFPLSFGASTGDKISLYGDSGSHFGFGIQGSQLQIFTDASHSDVVFGYGQSANLTETMRIKGNGNVGIGTQSPAVPLDVNGSGLLNTASSYGYLNSLGQAGPAGAANNIHFSIRASDRIWAFEFDAVSDRRIKDIIGQSDGQTDLEIIQKLRVTDFQMKDRVANGDTPRKGFIAQEVETVIPEAVTKSRQFVPDIYAVASGAKFDPAAKTIAVKMAKAHGLKAGDRVRLMTEAGQMDLTVSSVPSEQEFMAANCEKDPKQVFVFGKEVNDFRTLNYDRIFTTGISAMQELARRVSTLEAHEAEHVALEKRAARVDELEQEVADLRAVVGRLAKSQAHQASARGVSRQQGMSEQSGALLAADNAGVTQRPSTAQPGEL